MYGIPTPFNGASCGCGVQPKQLFVKKDGPNHNREFYACSKPRDDQCNFFKWGEDYRETEPGQVVGSQPKRREAEASGGSPDFGELKAMMLATQEGLNTLSRVIQELQRDVQGLAPPPPLKRAKGREEWH
jgi:hypothetical protein